jgi:signal transduction histidine kinase
MDKLIYNTEKLASIGTLAAGVAHEINNPLTIILGFTDLLKERHAPGTAEHKDLQIIEENANNAKRIVQDMLGFARITEGMEDTVDIKRSLGRVMRIVEVSLREGHVEIITEVPDGLPLVRGDPREVQQVFFNLVSNAVVAMQETGGTLTIKAWVDEGFVRVNVADTGIGIPDKYKGQIFDPFFTTKKVGEGTGLGLSLCYGIVKRYGGAIEFISSSKADHPAQPSGTTFTVSMPIWETKHSPKGDV